MSILPRLFPLAHWFGTAILWFTSWRLPGGVVEALWSFPILSVSSAAWIWTRI